MPGIGLRLAAVTTVLALTAGCAGSTTPLPVGASAPVPAPAVAHSSADPNLRPCGSVEAGVQSMRAPLAGWTPAARPFDKGVAATLRSTATDVRHQEQLATGPAKDAMHRWAAALTGLSAAINGKDPRAVKAAAATVTSAYAGLKRACKFDR